MKTVIYITIACFFLKWSGLMKKFLDRLKLPEAPEDPEAAEAPEVTRPQLQADAIYILESQGLTTEGVKYMSNRMLQKIINDYFEGRDYFEDC